MTIDAGNMCNEMRFLNHSATGNVHPITIWINGDARIGFFALRDIPAQTEMTFSYGFNFALGSEEVPDASQTPKAKPNTSRKHKLEPDEKPKAKKKAKTKKQ